MTEFALQLAGPFLRLDRVAAAFVRRLYALLLVAAAVGAGSCYAAYHLGLARLVAGWYPLVGLLTVASLVGAVAMRRRARWNLAALFASAVFSGLAVSPLAARLIVTGERDLVGFALALSAAGFTGLTVSALVLGRAWSWGRAATLYGAALVVALAWAGGQFPVGAAQVALCAAGQLLVGVFVISETRRLAEGADDDAVAAAISLMVSIVALAVVVLRLALALATLTRRQS